MKKTVEELYAEAKREIKRLKSRIRKGSNHCEACAEKDAEIKKLNTILDSITPKQEYNLDVQIHDYFK